jgi:HAE1 family hydrophobic/amphiphilic exporter-1
MFKGLLELAGEMFAGLAFTIVFSLACSLLVATCLVPVLASHYLPLVTRKQKPLKGNIAKVDKVFENFFSELDSKYRHAVHWVIGHKLIVCGSILAIFVGSLFFIPKIGWVFMPESDQDNVTVSVTLPLGTPLEETEMTLKRIQAIVEREVQGYERLVVNAGGGNIMRSGSSNSGNLRINLPKFDDRIDDANTIKLKLRKHFNEFPGVVMNFSSGGMNMGGGNPVDIILHTDDLVKGKATGEKIAALLTERIPAITEPAVDLKDGLPQYEIQLDRARMYSLGLNAYTVGNEIKAAVDGITATRYKSGGTDYDVVLILSKPDRSSLPALVHIFLVSPMTNERVPLSSFASYSKGTGPMSINRENQGRVIHVTAGVLPGTKLNNIEEQVRNLITAEIPAEDDLMIEFGGDNAEMIKMMTRFLLIIIIAIFLIFGVMASLFESFRDPFIILFCIPLAVIGVVAIYLATGEPFNVMTAVGLLVLVGVVINNGIVLVDYTNMLRKRGYSLHDACVEAAGNRLRPILMTTLTTVLGLAPMAFVPGEGSEMVGPIGKTVLGGLTVGTMMTLFLMPAIYYIFNKNSDARDARAEARRNRIAAGISKKQAKAAAVPLAVSMVTKLVGLANNKGDKV